MTSLQSFFYRYLTSRTLVSITNNTFLVFFLWVVVERYNSPFLAGLIATISIAAELISSIPIGHLIDRANSTVVGFIGSLLTLGGVIVLVLGDSLVVIYTVTTILSVGFMMKGDSFSATMKKHLDEDQYAKGNSFAQAFMYIASLVGTAVGGISIIFLSNYFIILLSALAASSLALSMPISERSSRKEGSGAMSEIASAISFYRRIAGFVAVAFILNGLFVSLEVYSSALFHIVLKASPAYYTIFVGGVSAGGIAGSALANTLKNRTESAFLLSFLIMLYAPLFLFLAFSMSAVGDIVIAFAIGLLIPVINVPLLTKLMKIIPRNIYGKIMAFLRVFLGGATPGMAAVLSFVALYLPVNTVLLYIGILMFPVTGLAFGAIPKFMKLEAEPESA